MKYYKIYNRITEVEKQDVVFRYLNKESIRKINESTKISTDVIKRILRENNIKLRTPSEFHRKYEIDEYYFDIIDTPEKAYWLGLLYADGGNYRKCITISLRYDDKYILEKFNECLKHTKPLRYRYSPAKEGEKIQNRAPQYKIEIQNERVLSNLEKLGVKPNKSFTLQFPTEEQVPSHLTRHFIRGYFDGDGCIYLAPTKGNARILIISSLGFCDSLAKTIENELKINTYRQKHDSEGIDQVVISGRLQVLKFYEWIYKDATTYLLRKYNKFAKLRDLEIKPTFNYKLTHPNGNVDVVENFSEWLRQNNIVQTTGFRSLSKNMPINNVKIEKIVKEIKYIKPLEMTLFGETVTIASTSLPS